MNYDPVWGGWEPVADVSMNIQWLEYPWQLIDNFSPTCRRDNISVGIVNIKFPNTCISGWLMLFGVKQ